MATQIVQAKCPKCKRVLRIPADWVNQTFQCKHCKTTIQGKPKAAAAPRPQPAQAIPQAQPVPPAVAVSPAPPLVQPVQAAGVVSPAPPPTRPAQPAPAAAEAAFPPLIDTGPSTGSGRRRRSRG